MAEPDTIPAITEEFIDQLKAQDSRWNDVDFAAKMEGELQNSEAVKMLLRVLSARAATALDKLVECDPTDTKRVVTLQAQVQCAKIMGETIESVRRKGALSAQALIEEDREGQIMNEEGKSNGDR